MVPGTGFALTPFNEDFLTDKYVGWLNDPRVVRFSENRHRHHSIDGCRSYYEQMRAGNHHFWAIVLEGNNHVGNLTAYVDHPNAVADLAIVIGENSARGRGLGRATWQSACDFLLSQGNMRKVTAGTMSVNVPMLRVMCSTGMQEEGRRRAQYIFEGQEVDLVMSARFRT
jgi:[ribosomal protein S5]-alanine N-acetyltransferase